MALQLSHGQQQILDQDPMITGQTLNIVHEIILPSVLWCCFVACQFVCKMCLHVVAASSFNLIVSEQCVLLLFFKFIHRRP